MAETTDELLARMAQKYGLPSAPPPQQPAPQPPAPQPQPERRGIIDTGSVSGVRDEQCGARGRCCTLRTIRADSFDANHQSTRAQGAPAPRVEEQGPGAAAE